MSPMQERPTPLEFVPQEHTDFIFQVSSWPALLATVGAAVLAVAAAVVWLRRRRRPHDEP